MEPTDGQRLVEAHDGGPMVVVGGFGSGVSAALRARADRLAAEGRRPLLLHHGRMVDLAVDLLRRHGQDVRLVDGEEQRALVRTLLQDGPAIPPAEAAAVVQAFQASFLGDEELRVHADAAGCLREAEALIAFSARYLQELGSRRLVDRAGAVVQASLRLRDLDVLAAERRRIDELLVDDYQLATFGTNRLVSQLAGPPGSAGLAVTVGGNPMAAVSEDPFSSPEHLRRFAARFGAEAEVTLVESHRAPGVPTLRIVEGPDEAQRVALEAVEQATGMGVAASDRAVIARELAPSAVGKEWAFVVVPDATEGRWPSERPRGTWFDDAVFSGPDVPADAERDRRWFEAEHRRFAVATSRATRFLLVIAEVPVTRFVADLVGPPEARAEGGVVRRPSSLRRRPGPDR